MEAANLHACTLAVLLSIMCSDARAQTVVTVSQALPFASRGAVTSLAKGEIATAMVPPSGGTTETSITPAIPATLIAEGGRVVTGANSATSLLLGTTGTARMGADTAVQVPETTEKNHSLELLKGRLFMNISGEELKKRAAGEFRLKTPAALLAVKGTKFFTVSTDGTDTIGVHEGSVTVTEPGSGKSVILEAGNAVSASPGILSEMRAMTDEENGYAPEYAAADLVRTPIPVAIKSPVPNTKKLQILLFQNGQLSVVGEESVDHVHYGTSLDPKIGPYLDWRVLKSGRNSNPVSPKLSADGMLSYVWTAKQPGAAYQCFFDFGGQSGTNYSDDSYSRLNRINPRPMPKNLTGSPVAIVFRARSKNVSAAYFAGVEGRKFAKAWSGTANDGDWTEVIMIRDKRIIPDFPSSHLSLVGSFKQGSTAATVMAMDLADFVLLTTPK
ncbi:FecR family protein [Prosthecobacter sp.]|uniref:FecR family protein n=1 Tax=Prosthecobacter sp. TaxID=1965333 RepID=UPI002AB8A396|nr:FecR family protein [Prosthecobacter sp.]MDZ4401898.1 FecR family protein [Prosthecobacter sp.]